MTMVQDSRQIMQHHDHGPPLARPVIDQRQQIRLGRLVNGGEGLIQQDHRRILDNGAGEQGALQLSCGQGMQRHISQYGRSCPLHRRIDGRPAFRVDASGKAKAGPGAHLDNIAKTHRHPCVKLGTLTKKGNLRRSAAVP